MDIWAFGCFAFELATGQPPFLSMASDTQGLISAILNKPAPAIPERWSADFKDFINHCLEKNPNDRWTIDMLLDHPFFAKAEKLRAEWVANCDKIQQKELEWPE